MLSSHFKFDEIKCQTMNKFSFFTIVSLSILIVSCVPARKLEELQLSYDDLKSQYDEMKTLKEFGENSLADLQARFSSLSDNYNKLKSECDQQREDYEKTQASYEILNSNYNELVNSNENTKKDLRYELERLDKQLNDKKRELFTKESSLIAKEQEANKLKKDLEALAESLKERENRVNELESKLAAQETAVKDLKDRLTNSLIGYKNSGISVIENDGKVYVSLDNSLLFQSGKIDIDWKGKTALLKVAESLQNIEDFDIMVEGHTDNIPMKSSTIKDNWDLSVLRATSVVRHLTTEGKMDPIKIIPSGRSKFVPIDSSKTREARAKNRRIEIILTPKLDSIMELLK
jgi:chemotaxis protein MotB